jgi:hypothetical protein
MDFFKFCFSNRIKSSDMDNNFDFIYIIDKYSNSHQENILLSLIMTQISYYPSKYFTNYTNKLIQERMEIKPRERNISIDTETDFIELNLMSLPSSREIKRFSYKDSFDINDYVSESVDVTPFSTITKNIVDNKILINELKNVEKIIEIYEKKKYSFKLYLYNITKKSILYIIPIMDIYDHNVYNNLEEISKKILDKLSKNTEYLNYFLNPSFNCYEKIISGHLYSSYISVNLSLYLQKIYINNVYLYLYHPLLDKPDYLKNLFKSSIKYDIFSVDIYDDIPSLLHKKIIWIREDEMVEYYPDKDCNCELILCKGHHKIKKKKNIRSYVYTLFTRFPTFS